MKNINFQYKKEIVDAINRFHSAGYTSAIVAGGAIRDSIMNKPVSDIDLYVWDPEYSRDPWSNRPLDTRTIWKLFSNEGKKQKHQTKQSRLSYAHLQSTITSVINVFTPNTKIQVIQTKMKPLKFIERKFNIGLCKCYFDGERIRLTPDFLHDMNNKKLTVVAPDMSFDELQYTMNYHLPKLQRKYPDFSQDLAPHNKQKFDEMIKQMLTTIPF